MNLLHDWLVHVSEFFEGSGLGLGKTLEFNLGFKVTVCFHGLFC